MALLFAAACSVDLPAEQILCGPPPDRCPDGWYCHETDGHCRRTPESDACEPPARGSRLDWSLVFAPQEQQATISAIEIDSFDNVYISGSAFGPLDLGCGEVSPPNVSADRDGFVARLSPEGRLDWLRMFGANGVDDIIDLALGASALMVTGRFSGQPAIEMADGTVRDLASNAGSDDIVVAALDPMTGTAIWVETFGGPREDTASAITTRGRRVCLTGRFREQIFFEGEPHVADDESSNAFVACLDGTTGQPLWSAVELTAQAATGHDVLMDGLGERLFAAGSSGRTGYIRRYDAAGAGYMEAGEYLVDADTSGAIWSIAQSLDDGAIWILGGFVGTWGAWDSGPELDAFVIALPEDLSAARWSRQIQLQGSQTEAIVSNGEIAVASDRVWVGVPFSSTAVVETEMSTAAGAFDGLVVAHRRDTGARLVTEQLGATDTATITAVHVFEDQLFLGGSLRGSMSHPSPLSGAPLGTISAFLVASEAAP